MSPQLIQIARFINQPGQQSRKSWYRGKEDGVAVGTSTTLCMHGIPAASHSLRELDIMPSQPATPGLLVLEE